MSEATIKSDPNCMEDHDPNSVSVEGALSRIQDAISPVTAAESVPIRDGLNRVLAQDVASRVNVPNHTNSAMDGYAISSQDIPEDGTTQLQVMGTVFAGQYPSVKAASGECVRIMTGAPIPEGTNTVVMQEHVERQDDTITIDNRHRPGQNVRQAGEDLAVGRTALPKGRRLIPADIGMLASAGVSEVMVFRKPRIAFFSTGDELKSVGEPLETGMIYDSNRYTLHGMLTRLGVEIIDMGVIRDTREDTRNAFTQAADNADVIITSGGVSVGEADFVKDVLAELGNVRFWKVSMKPGRPLAFGNVQEAYFFGLPGNPVSVMATFYILVQPALKKLMNEPYSEPLTLRVRCDSTLRKRSGRVEYQRGTLKRDDQGQWTVSDTGPQGSGILRSMSEANCFVILPIENNGVSPGDEVEVLPFTEII